MLTGLAALVAALSWPAAIVVVVWLICRTTVASQRIERQREMDRLMLLPPEQRVTEIERALGAERTTTQAKRRVIDAY